MKSAPTSLAVLFLVLAPLCFSEDVQLRQEAVRLLEKANVVSTLPHLPNLERIDTFKVFGSDSSIQEGNFTRVVIQGIGRREETNFVDYHVVDVWTKDRLATVRNSELAPPDIVRFRRLTPIHLVRFDEQDIIRDIVNREVNGQALRCIDFDSVAGQKSERNELCVDMASGALVIEKFVDDMIENRDFFRFAGALMPGKISYWQSGVLKMEITQTMSVLAEDTANVLAAPPSADVRKLCTTFRRPFGLSMPQPKPGNGGNDTEVILRGIIAAEGKVHDAVVRRSDRADLDAEALRLVQQWVFTPGMCDGQPNATEASFTLHFQGR